MKILFIFILLTSLLGKQMDLDELKNDANKIIKNKHILIETRSLVSWKRFFSNPKKCANSSYNLSSYEREIMLKYIKNKIKERDDDLSIGI